MEFKIKIFQEEEGVFAEVVSEDGTQICVADGDSPYLAAREACLVFADILSIMEENENRKIASIIQERINTDDGVRYSIDDVKNMRLN